MVRNVTFLIEEELLKKARAKAMLQHKSLNEIFREWIRQFADIGENRSKRYKTLMQKLAHAVPGRKFSREEMNER